MPAPVGFAILGLDHWYNAFPTIDAIVRGDGSRLAVIADPDLARAQEVAGRYGVPALGDLNAALHVDGVDAVASFASADRHAELALAVLAAGKPLLAIKPMARDLAAADRIVAAVRRTGLPYFAGEGAFRLTGYFRTLHGWMDEGRFGRPASARAVFHAELPRQWPGATTPGWFADPARVPGGAWIDHAIYSIDTLRWLFGSEVEDVSGMTARIKWPDLQVEDYGVATLRFASGCIGVVEDSWLGAPGLTTRSTALRGTKGGFRVDHLRGRLDVSGRFEPLRGWQRGALPSGGATLVEHFVACVRGEETPAATAEDGRANLAVCLAFYEAARSGCLARPAPAPSLP